MDTKKTVIFIDTNVFVIDLRYKNDINYKTNLRFLDFISKHKKGMTSIINLLEVCGILSFNLNRQQVLELFYYLPKKYGIDIIPSNDIDSFLPEASVKNTMDIICKKASLGDALVANLINHSLDEKGLFVSWDAEHFKGLLSMKALTPKEYMEERGKKDEG